MKPIEFYSNRLWGKNSSKGLLDREKKAMEFMKSLIKMDHQINFLDVGCGNGKFISYLHKKYPYLKFWGIDYSKDEIEKASRTSFNFKRVNLEKGTPFPDEHFDIIYAAEIIEHMYNPDFLLSEINRILKKDGFLILSTPNLCSVYNRILMLFGIQPLFIETSVKSNLIGAGMLKKFKTNLPVGHIRIFNKTAIEDILKDNGFNILKIRGAIFESFPIVIKKIDKAFSLFPTLSSGFIILSKKIENADNKNEK